MSDNTGGAGEHITDPGDRTELAALAYELYQRHGSLRKTREALAVEPATLRIKGKVHLFSTDTLRTWIAEGRAAEAYVALFDLMSQRFDSDMRFRAIGAMAWDRIKLGQGDLSPAELASLLDLLRKIEVDRGNLLGLRAPIKVQNVGPEGEVPNDVKIDMIAAIAKLREQRERERSALAADYPPPTALPGRRTRRGTHRPPPDPPDRRTS